MNDHIMKASYVSMVAIMSMLSSQNSSNRVDCELSVATNSKILHDQKLECRSIKQVNNNQMINKPIRLSSIFSQSLLQSIYQQDDLIGEYLYKYSSVEKVSFDSYQKFLEMDIKLNGKTLTACELARIHYRLAMLKHLKSGNLQNVIPFNSYSQQKNVQKIRHVIGAIAEMKKPLILFLGITMLLYQIGVKFAVWGAMIDPNFDALFI